jgi:hypothetical protein
LIRFIDLGKQIATDPDDHKWSREFCFYDTLEAQFVSFDRRVVFDSFDDLKDCLDENDVAYGRRILGLLPSWVPKSTRSIER